MKRHAVALLLLLPNTMVLGGPILRYERSGGQFYGNVSVSFEEDGSTHAEIRRSEKESYAYDLILDEFERQYLRSLIDSSRLLSSGELQNSASVDQHYGQSKFILGPKGTEKTGKILSARDHPNLEEFLHLIVNQAMVMHRLSQYDDVYSAMIAVSPRAAAPKVLQTRVFREPLVELVRRSADRIKTGHALEALQYLLSPEQFSGLVRQALFSEDGTVQTKWRFSIPFGNLEKPFQSGLMPVFLNAAIQLKSKEAKTNEEDAMFLGFLETMAGQRYQPAISLVLEMKSELSGPRLTPRMIVLARFGLPALPHIRDLLQSTDLNTRLNACELVLLCARLNPDAEYANPVGKDQYDQIRRYITGSVVPVIDTIAKNASGESKTKVEATREMILTEMAKEQE